MKCHAIWDFAIASMIFCALLGLCTCCTMSISIVDTHGESDDVVDSEPKEDLKADVSVPVMPI